MGGVIHLRPNMQAAGFFSIISLLLLTSLINLMETAAMEDLINQIHAVNDSTGYASEFKESSFVQVEGIKQLEEDFFPHEDLVRLAPPNATAGTWGLQSKHMLVAALSLSAFVAGSRLGI